VNIQSITLLCALLTFGFTFLFSRKKILPNGFVYADIIPDLNVELRIFSVDVFVGDTITGYSYQ
jgi:hypothetical protein